MRRILLLALFIAAFTTTKSQDLSYTCPRDTILGCNTACFTITGRFPDIKSLSTDYTFVNTTSVSACRPYVDPGGPGPSTDIDVDDTYSEKIPIGFNFPFYGILTPTLVVSTNGYLSFDTSRATLFAAWSLAGNVPATGYDKALVMGPWHDIDPGQIAFSPNLQIKYNLYGNAPNRKWILSFYKVPLFSGACNPQIENTHQIILHESTGIIEVYIKDKEQCPTWNSGKAMIGLQDWTKTKGIVPPGRGAVDPPWGSIGMNETWRFIPKDGPTLYRSVQLLDGTGAVVATGDTTRINGETFETTFPNVCPPPGNSIYVIKTTYAKIDDLTQTIFSLDTINVIRQATLPVSATMTPTTCGNSSGTVTVTVSGGTAPYQYSIDGGTLQSSNVFTGIAAGPHSIYAVDAAGCNNTITITVTSQSSIPGSATTTATSCPGVNNGTITVTPFAGTAPFSYVMDGGTPQAGNIFTGVTAGSHTIVFTDANACTGTVTVSVTAGAAITSTAVTVAVSCTGANNGSTTVTPTSGTAPYSFTIDGGASQPTGVFTGLTPGNHTVVITDANGCTGTRTVNVGSGSGITSTQTNTFTSCPGVNNGTITITPTNGTAPYTYSIDGGPFQPSNIFTGLAAGSHTITIRDFNGCTGTRTVTITQGTAIAGTATSTAASCPGATNGSITVIPVTGTAPYTYTMNGGPSQSAPLFPNVIAGTHTMVMTDVNGCTATLPVTVFAGPGISGSTSSTSASCPGANNGTVTVTPSSGTAPYIYSINGGAPQASAMFTGVAAGTHTLSFADANGCTATTTATVTAGPAITGTATATGTSCPGVNNGTATVTSVSGPAPYIYSIDGGPSQASATFTGLATGSHTITFTDANGCNGTVSVTVDQGAPLTGTATSTNTSCPTVNNGTITAIPSSGGAPYTYSIDGGTTYVAGATFTNLAPGTYTITIRDNAGCTGTVSATVIAGANIASDIVVVNPPCANINDGTITINPTSGSGPYQYSLNGGLLQPNNVYTNLAPGTYTIAITDAIGCTGTNTATLTTNSPLATTVALTQPLCNGNANGIATLAASGGVAPYQYSINAGVTYQSSGTFNTLTAGTHTIRIKDNVGCIKDTTFTLGQPSALTATANGTSTNCVGNEGTVVGTGSGGTAPYQYSLDGVNFQNNPVLAAPGPGVFTVTVRDANGCTTTASANVVLTDNMGILELGADTTICAEQSVTLQPSVHPSADIFAWTPDSTISATNIKNPTVTPLSTIMYYLQATWGACSRIDSITVNVLKKPVSNAGPDRTICDNDSTLLEGSFSNTSGPVYYVWTPTASVREDSTLTTWAVPDSTQTFVLTITDDYGCNFSVTDSVVITMMPPVPAFAGNDTIAILGVPHQLTASGGTQYVWSHSASASLSSPFSPNPLATLTGNAHFTVIVTDIAGCVGYDTIYVQAYNGPAYYMPNAFSPNGDGLNDVFRAIPVGIEKTDYFRIFNRYGQLMFETNQWLKGWDGTYKGKKQPVGAYVWIIKGKDKAGGTVELKGTVMLVQ